MKKISLSILCAQPHSGKNTAHFLSLFSHQVLLLCAGVQAHAILQQIALPARQRTQKLQCLHQTSALGRFNLMCLDPSTQEGLIVCLLYFKRAKNQLSPPFPFVQLTLISN